MNTYAKCAAKPRRMNTSGIIGLKGLKVSWNEHLQKSRGGVPLIVTQLSPAGRPRLSSPQRFKGSAAASSAASEPFQRHRNRARLLRHIAAVISFALIFAVGASAGTVTGVIHNGTNNKPAAGVDVILIQLQGGMQPVANTKTDAQGHYKLDNAAIGQGPMLIRAVYRGVMFHQPLTPGTATVDVTVFDPTSDPKTMKVGSRLIVFQPNGSNLVVGEEYSLQNQSQPPLAYFNEKGDFNFAVPDGAQLSQVSSWGPSGMPVVQGTIDRGEQKYAIAYAFQPGDNGVRMSYQVPYATNSTTLKFDSDYPAARVMLVAPPTVQVTSAGFSPAGTEQGFNLYTRDAMPAGLPFEVSVSGTAPPPQQGGADQGQGQDAQAQDPVNGRDSAVTIQTMPDRLDSLRWILVAGFAALFALGIVFVWRRPIAVMAPAGAQTMAPPPSGPRAGRKQAAAPPAPEKSVPAPPAQAAPVIVSAPAPAQTVQTVARDVETSLDGLKDRLFRLELRRQAGTISEEEYARERSRTEEVLRELVRG
jgi:hypothetical protein